MPEVAVLGGGSWGTALAHHMAGCGHSVRLLFRSATDAGEVEKRRENRRYLPGVDLPGEITCTADPAAALKQVSLILMVSPVRGLDGLLGWLAGAPAVPLVSCAKGVREDTLETPLQFLARQRPDLAGHLAVLSGPSFARELAAGDPTAVVVASATAGVARQVQDLVAGGRLRIYRNADPIGVELAGALKNVIALATGVIDGLGFGTNAMAALVTRGLSEITRLGVALGGSPSTFAGLAGMGDLVLTCTGGLSRNRQVGRELGRGRRLDDIIASMEMVAEGIGTTRAARELAAREGVEMPIVEQMSRVLFEGCGPAEAVEALLSRDMKAEDRY